MRINSISPNFTGFVKAHKSNEENSWHFINTARIVDIKSEEHDGGSSYTNTISYIDMHNNLRHITNMHPSPEISDDWEQPIGEDFVDAVAKTCVEADKTGEILTIGVWKHKK